MKSSMDLSTSYSMLHNNEEEEVETSIRMTRKAVIVVVVYARVRT